MTELPRIGVLGLGRLGTCLSRALHAAKLPLSALASSDSNAAISFGRQLSAAVQVVSVERLHEHAELIFLTIPDARVADALSQLGIGAAHALVHTSGALALDVLTPARSLGAGTGVFHPLQAFARGAAPDRFAGIQIGIETATEALALQLTAVAHRLGAHVFSLAGVDRAAYHAAAVFVSNYQVALHGAAARAWALAGLPPEAARAALVPLAQGALRAIAQHELADALTGPVARADVATVERHLVALAGDPNVLALYRALAEELLRLPLALDAGARARLEAALGLSTGA
jgi:predicted short-subunit dehydrogenase-like oxidoreductase (DUF2520 family)